ncbi:MAG: hypothetical protein B7Y02_19330, partial [Rhodobacterales bacterium 17-64-5]
MAAKRADIGEEPALGTHHRVLEGGFADAELTVQNGLMQGDLRLRRDAVAVDIPPCCGMAQEAGALGCRQAAPQACDMRADAIDGIAPSATLCDGRAGQTARPSQQSGGRGDAWQVFAVQF